MPLEQSILKSTKKILGLDANYNAFDLDVITHINTCFFTLNQLGVGPAEGFSIEDDSAVWDDYFVGGENYHAVKTYVYLKVRSLFDPPEPAHHVSALADQITELEHRLRDERSVNSWVPRLSSPFPL